MGLDANIHIRDRFPEDTNSSNMELAYETIDPPENVIYFRKHNALHGYMEARWQEQTYEQFQEACDINVSQDEWLEYKQGQFNCIPLFFTKDLILQTIAAVEGNKLEATPGFFFGDYSEEGARTRCKEEKPDTLRALKECLDAVENKRIAFYDSWW